jgi:hypothetical protein
MDEICFHGTEITCDLVSPEHADAKGFIYRESEIKAADEEEEEYWPRGWAR